MKKNNNLILEISKIQKLMTGKLIVEQWGSIIDDVIELGAKIAGKLPDDVDGLISRLGKVASEEEAIKILADIAKQSDEMAAIIVPKIMSTISDAERKTINDLKTLFKNEIANGLDPDYLKASAESWVNQNVKTEFEGVKDIIKNDLLDYIETAARKTTPTPKPKPKPKPTNTTPGYPKSITDVAGQSWEEIKPLTASELANLEKLYRQKGLGKSFFKALRQFGKSIVDMMTKQYELMDETLSLIKTLDETTNAAQKVDIATRIGENVKTLTQRDIENYKIIEEWIDTNVLDYKLKNKLKNIKGYQKAAQIFDNTTLLEWKKTYKTFWERRGELLKQANSMMNPASWFGASIRKWPGDGSGEKIFNKWKSFVKGPEFTELRNYILTGQTQKWSGIKKFREEFGMIPTIGNVTKELAYSYVVLSLLLGLLDYLTDVLGNTVRNFKYINEFGVIKSQIESYDKHIKSEKSKEGVEKSAGGLLNFLGDVGEYTFEELKTIQLQFPGLIDNFFALWYDLRNKPISEENIKKAQEGAEKIKQTVKKEKKIIEDKSRNVIDSTKSQGESAVKKVDENIIDIEKDIKPTYPCLFGEGWTVDLVNVNNKPTYVTHNPDWSKKYYLDVIKKDGVTIVSFQATGDKVVC